MMRRRFSIAVAVVCVALAACSADPPAGPAGAQPGRSGPQSPSPEPSPSPSGPCAEGTCEIEVAADDVVTVPRTYGLGPIEVTAITEDAVEMAAPLTGSGYSVSGCSGGGGVSSQGGGGVTLRCDQGTVATINDAMSLEVVEVGDDSAVLRIEPAG